MPDEAKDKGNKGHQKEDIDLRTSCFNRIVDTRGQTKYSDNNPDYFKDQ
jgi:hypothetical protein